MKTKLHHFLPTTRAGEPANFFQAAPAPRSQKQPAPAPQPSWPQGLSIDKTTLNHICGYLVGLFLGRLALGVCFLFLLILLVALLIVAVWAGLGVRLVLSLRRSCQALSLLKLLKKLILNLFWDFASYNCMKWKPRKQNTTVKLKIKSKPIIRLLIQFD